MEMHVFRAQAHLHYAQSLTGTPFVLRRRLCALSVLTSAVRIPGEGEVRTQLGKEVAHMRKAQVVASLNCPTNLLRNVPY